MVSVLGKSKFVKCLPSLQYYGIAFIGSTWASPVGGVTSRNVLDSIEFDIICSCLLGVCSNSILVFTDDSLAGLSTVDIQADAAVFFDGVNLSLGVVVSGLVFSTMVELQAIALALKCVPPSSSVHLFSDSQAALDACRSELIKGHSGIMGNEHADALAVAAFMSDLFLLLCLNEYYILAGGMAVSGNSKYFVRDIFHYVYHAKWEVGFGFKVLVTSLHGNINWHRSLLMWHLDIYMAAGFTGKHSAGAHTYFMKALHH
ncbi:hypothetical protein G9A89_020919 [Geosiphon pyriformis]|nr:hypothetical protein G9A89_020919 [Geosiphon pyriformis]